jgi:hypothetical protein
MMRRWMRAAAVTGAVAAAATLGPMGVAVQTAGAIDCYETPSASDPWYDGASASVKYDQNFAKGFKLPQALYDRDGVPQGVAVLNNWNGTNEDLFLVSAYTDENHDKSPDGDSWIYAVVAGEGTFKGAFRVYRGKAGGLAVAGGYLHVANTDTVRSYALSRVKDAIRDNGGYLASDASTGDSLASWVAADGGDIWVGNWNPDGRSWMHRRPVRADGLLGAAGPRVQVPKKAQGMAATSSHFIFSTSEGQWSRSNIYVVERGYGEQLENKPLYCFRAPTMSEGAVIWNANAGAARFYVIYESKANTYLEGLNPTNEIDHAHYAKVSDLVALVP